MHVNPDSPETISPIGNVRNPVPPGRRLIAARILRYLFAAFTIAAAVAVAYYVIILVSPTEITVGPVRVEFSLRPSWHGKTIVDLPPAGTIEADTHTAPAPGRLFPERDFRGRCRQPHRPRLTGAPGTRQLAGTSRLRGPFPALQGFAGGNDCGRVCCGAASA